MTTSMIEMPDELSIVDVFTRLIFDTEFSLGARDRLIVDILIDVEPSLGNASRRDISEALRAMSVDEMIAVVKAVMQYFDKHKHLLSCQKVPIGLTTRY